MNAANAAISAGVPQPPLRALTLPIAAFSSQAPDNCVIMLFFVCSVKILAVAVTSAKS
jgi:hypothetical protein